VAVNYREAGAGRTTEKKMAAKDAIFQPPQTGDWKAHQKRPGKRHPKPQFVIRTGLTWNKSQSSILYTRFIECRWS